MSRIIWGGIVGGIIVFVWGFVANVLLPIGHMGISELPDEAATVATLEGAVPEAGFYFFPYMAPEDNDNPEVKEAWDAEYAAGPRGILIYDPEGDEPMGIQTMITQFVISVLGAIIASIVVSQTATGYGARVLVVMLMGAFAWIAVDASYWNWYLFPTDKVAATLIQNVVGWFAAGIVIAGIVRGRLR
jgi:hypothetical protein